MVLVDVVANNIDVFNKALNMAMSSGRVIYVFPEVLGFAALIPMNIFQFHLWIPLMFNIFLC
ncbi:hypothetical protein QPL79_08275 [Ignisphaera sp. 4213-co]|uniref:Uncharacterized protein n=1 Tax=Ignisphaera cupida TaxID=3050454 RepID=A0ABD4Z7N1_9CREN|nr:hypothetical protein [Ignisphaera sp. 4213-co]MDK6029356.1 hypothetical protein [Ignisphaera sp. 4213-co]